MNIYQPIEVTIEDIIPETPTIKSFVLKPKQSFEFKTGQFVELTIPGLGEAPFTPSSDPKFKDRIEVTVMNVGMVTSAFHNLKKEDKLGLRGPYGVGYPLDELKNKEVLIVGGGVGLAPLRSLLFSLLSNMSEYKRILLRYGARSPKDIIYKEAIEEWSKKENLDVVTTLDLGDSTWKGNVGVVTTILKDLNMELRESKAIVCGPPIMMRFTTLKLLELGFHPGDIYLSMEKNMSCGLGKCGHCRLGKFYVCKDGPVFSYEQVKEIPDVWD